MPRISISVKKVKTFAEQVPWGKVFKKAANTERGQRVWPTRTPRNDSKYNFRFDKGSVVDGKHELILQANKNASDPGEKAAAAKDSHVVLGKVLVDPESPEDEKAKGEKAIGDLLESFEDRSE